MTIPSTGTNWKDGGFADIDSRFVERGGLVAALIRDYGGEDTNISPFESDCTTQAWSPFALDGKLRDDLFAYKRVDGVWVPNPSPNEGFWFTGANTDDGGPERGAKVEHDDLMVLQSNFPFDSDKTSEGKTVKFTMVESAKPLTHRIANDLPLIDDSGTSLVADPGATDYFVGKPVDTDFAERQLVLIFARTKGGKTIYRAEGYPYCKLTDIGSQKADKKKTDGVEVTYTVLPDPFFLIPDPTVATPTKLVPALEGKWYSGPGWDALNGSSS